MPHGPVLLVGAPIALETALRATLREVDFLPVPLGVPLQLREPVPRAAVVCLEENVEPAFRLVRELERGGVRVTVVGPSKDADLILRAMREGAKEYVLSGDHEALARALRQQIRPPRLSGVGYVYAVLPAKGGVGATTLAVNLAAAFQRERQRTCIVDLDLALGDVLTFLDVSADYSIADLVGNVGRLDRALLEATLPRHASGVRVLAQTHHAARADTVDAAAVTTLLQFLREHFDVVVVDGLRPFDELSLAVLDACDAVLLPVTQEVPAVRNAATCADVLRRLGCGEKVRLVVNRYGKKNEITLEVVASTVGIAAAATIANDYGAASRCLNKGLLLLDDAPHAQITSDIRALVPLLGHATGNVAAVRPSLLKRMFPRVSHAAQ